MSNDAFASLALDQLADVAGGAAETPSIYDSQFRADVLAPCALAAGLAATQDVQQGKTPDSQKLVDVCAGAVGLRKVIKAGQSM